MDRYGNVWVANYNDGLTAPSTNGSVTRIGLVVGGTRVQKVIDGSGNTNFVPSATGEYLAPPFIYSTCVDRDGDGLIQTSYGLSNVLSWSNMQGTNTGVDTLGARMSGTNLLRGVETAQDEALINYVRTPGKQVKTVAVDKNNNLWAFGGQSPQFITRINGVTGLTNLSLSASCGSFGGLIDQNGILWSTSEASATDFQFSLLDTGGTNPICVLAASNTSPAYPFGDYAVGVDPNQGDIWITSYQNTNIARYRYVSGTLTFIGETNHGYATAQGVAVDCYGNVWVAHGRPATPEATDVGHLVVSGTNAVYLGSVALVNSGLGISQGDGPTAISIDSAGKVWVTLDQSDNLMRIDPNGGSMITASSITRRLGAVDKMVYLGSRTDSSKTTGPSMDGYSDMTGFVTLGTTIPSGMWDFVHDGGTNGMAWGTLSWTPRFDERQHHRRGASGRPVDRSSGSEFHAGYQRRRVLIGPTDISWKCERSCLVRLARRIFRCSRI